MCVIPAKIPGSEGEGRQVLVTLSYPLGDCDGAKTTLYDAFQLVAS